MFFLNHTYFYLIGNLIFTEMILFYFYRIYIFIILLIIFRMNIISICVTFISVILGIAYPILLQVISKLDEKYSSVIILKLFNKE